MNVVISRINRVDEADFDDSQTYCSTTEVIPFNKDYSADVYLSCDISKNKMVSLYFHVDCPVPVVADYKFNIKTIKKEVFDKKIVAKNSSGFEFFQFAFKDEVFNAGRMTINWNLLLKPRFPREYLLCGLKPSDFVIVCQGKQFQVHKDVLALSSPVFDAMFRNDFIESNEGKTIIDDFQPKTIENALNFIYSSVLKRLFDVEQMLDLFRFADKYNLKEKETINARIEAFVNVHNVCRIAQFMKSYARNRIYEKCVRILVENLKTMTNLKQFDVLTFEVVKDVLHQINPTKSA
uniref:BTB domain-containing protein n=1 Tax=Panagrolaimus sp. JU765 TaxID=591449 RepID=A0AC34QMF0_9BILA